MPIKLKGKSVLVLGLGISGCSAVRYLLAQGCIVFAFDDRWESIKHQNHINELQSLGLKICPNLQLPDVELLVVSPGVPRTHPLYISAQNQDLRIIGEAELALGTMSKDYKCVGITGTNGKTTVTFLIEHILNTCGVHAKALGNSGIPLTSSLAEKFPLGTFIVAELSSFQLETLQSPVLDAAVLLNITHDHLDRYDSFMEYAQAKIHLFDCVKPGGKCYIEERCYCTFLNQLSNYMLGTFGLESGNYLRIDGCQLVTPTSKLTLPAIPITQSGHDLENVMAAFAITANFVPAQEIINALSTYKKPPHRLELVREIQGITFIDDSKATNVDAVVRAVESISSPIILIAGGVDKGGSYQSWLDVFHGKVRAICTIGQAADKIQQELGHKMPIYPFKELREAVAFAASMANRNEIVLLSPGCSSYDMFSSYVQRGKAFQEIVHALDFVTIHHRATESQRKTS